MNQKRSKQVLTFFATRPIWGLIPVRIAFGSILFLHGVTRLIEVRRDTGAFIEELPSEVAFGIVVTFAVIEFIGGALVIPGFLTRIAGFLISIEMIVSITTERLPLGFSGGFQLELLLFVVAGMLLMSGPGRFSVDRYIARRLLKKYPSQKHEAYCIAETPHCKWYE